MVGRGHIQGPERPRRRGRAGTRAPFQEGGVRTGSQLRLPCYYGMDDVCVSSPVPKAASHERASDVDL